MSASSNLGLLFFVVAIIYLCMLVVLICRTAQMIFSCKNYSNQRRMQVFRAFYGSLWVQTVLNCALYWVLFGNQAGATDPTAKHEGFKAVVLIFVPTILMSLDFALMYLQLEDMNKRARAQGGVAYFKKENHIKLQKIMNIVTFSYVGIFIVVQTVVMVLTALEFVSPRAFLVELNTLILFLMIFVNAQALVYYCRNAGNPYLSAKNKRYVRKFKTVVVIWNAAFITKFFMSSFGVSIVNIDENTPTDDFWYSVETFANIMFTEIIPFYFVLDKKIVKIFTLQFLELNEAADVILADRNSTGSSHNNSADLDADEEVKLVDALANNVNSGSGSN